MNKAMQIRDAVIVVERLELARAINVHLLGLLLNANSPLDPTSGAEIGSYSWVETTVDGKTTSDVRDGAFKIERTYTDVFGFEIVILSRYLQPDSDHPGYEDFIIIHCKGARMIPHVDQKLYTLPYDDTAVRSITDFLE